MNRRSLHMKLAEIEALLGTIDGEVNSDQSGEIEEFTLGKTSQILVDGKEAKITDITKDKNTIIISHEEKGKQLIDLIYLLP